MFAAKIKTAAAVVLSLALLGTGGGMFGYRIFAPEGAVAAEEGKPDAAPVKPPAREEALRKQLAAMRQQLDAMREQMEQQEKMIKAQAEQLRRSAQTVGVFTPDDFKAQMDHFRRISAGADPTNATNPFGTSPATPAQEIEVRPSTTSATRLSPGAQVAIKKSHLEAANAELSSAKKRVQSMQITRKQFPGAVSQDVFDAAQSKLRQRTGPGSHPGGGADGSARCGRSRSSAA